MEIKKSKPMNVIQEISNFVDFNDKDNLLGTEDDSEWSQRKNVSRKHEDILNIFEQKDTVTQGEMDEDVGFHKVKTKRGKKKKLYLTICTTNCKYELVRQVAGKYGMKEVNDDSPWNLYWTDLSISIERAKDMKRFQKVNHFPGMTEICRKDLLARNLNRMLRLFSNQAYNFFPKTWCLPTDYGELLSYAKTKRSKTFIIKPDMGCQGRGIYLTKSLKDIKPYDRMICQIYLSKPLLVDGYKFDLRVYTLITSCDPLKIYVYNDGLARFATTKYKEPTGHNTSNVFMHLTNYAVNKHSRMYVTDEEAGSKRKISTLNRILKTNGINIDELWEKIDEIIVKTIISAHPILKHSYKTCFSTHNLTNACFEILGFDILIDWKSKPYLLEVNHSPSFHTDAQIDRDVKEGLLSDTFKLLNLHKCDKKKIIEQDRKRVRDRLLQGIITKESSEFTIVEKKFSEEQDKWETENMGNFRKVYPCDGDEKYEPFFKQNSNSMFQETAASRAREEASKIQREEAIIKMKEEECKRMAGKLDTDRSNSLNKITPASTTNKNTTFIRKKRMSLNSTVEKSKLNKFCSFVPETINDTEERDRIESLAQREFLIKSHGILERIYLTMQKNGMLRPVDVKKYGKYEKLRQESESCLIKNMSRKIDSEINS